MSRSRGGSLFVGPFTDPDRFELLAPARPGSAAGAGEGEVWRAGYPGEPMSPLGVAVRMVHRPRDAGPVWPSPADRRRIEERRSLLQYVRIDHLVTMIDVFTGPPPHRRGATKMTGAGASAGRGAGAGAAVGLGVSTGAGRGAGAGRAAGAGATVYLTTEWVPGPTLAQELAGRPAVAATLDARLAHVEHVAGALSALDRLTSSAGHPALARDVTPESCILDPHRGVVLVGVSLVDAGGEASTPERSVAGEDLPALGALACYCLLGADLPAGDGDRQRRERLLAGARAAGVADAEGFVAQLGAMLDPPAPHRPADPVAPVRRLRALATVRARERALRHRRVLLVGGVVGLLLALFLVHGRMRGDDGASGPPAVPAGARGANDDRIASRAEPARVASWRTTRSEPAPTPSSAAACPPTPGTG